MSNRELESMKNCFNMALLGWRKKEKRQDYQRCLLAEYPVVGGAAFCAFSQAMEMREDPSEYLHAYYNVMKEIYDCESTAGQLTDDQWCSFTNKMQELLNSFYTKYDRYSAVLDIPVVILKMFMEKDKKQEKVS